ncbi:hypothetical protein [Streptomyces glaucosporus]
MRSGLAVTAALCAVAALPGTATAAEGTAGPADLPAYRTAEDARPVEGRESSAEGPSIEPGVYTDDIAPGRRKYYGVRLDAKSNAWISAVALPEPGSAVAYGDGIKVGLKAPDGTTCGESDVVFGDENAARPLADYAWRLIKPDGYCQEEKVYHFYVERESDAGSDRSAWPVEIRFMLEPGLKSVTSTTPPEPQATLTPPDPPAGEARPIEGGTGFNDAAGMGEGNWKDRLRPGETRFYQVPVDWGQQFFVDLEFGTTKARDDKFVSGAFRVDVYNPARGHVDSESGSYRASESAEISLASQRVAFLNRYAPGAELSGMRFAGWYYIAVHAHEDLAESVTGSVPVVLRTSVEGVPKGAPDYDGNAAEAGFGVTDGDREAAARGLSEAEARAGATLRTVGWAGVGTGTALLLGLGLWTVLARRGAARR